MIGQIGHLGKVSLRTGIAASLLYTLGITLGAGLVGLALGTAGLGARWLLHLEGSTVGTHGFLLAAACLASVGGLRDLGFLRFSWPQPFRQVPAYWWQVFGPLKTSFLWGLGIGLAYSTMVVFSLYYVLAGWVLLWGRPGLGAAALATYGFTQGTLLTLEMLLITRGARSPGGLLGLERSNWLLDLSGASLLAIAVFLVAQPGLIGLSR
jgi:hypothetical protein